MTSAIAALLLAAAFSPGGALSVDAGASSLRYRVVHKLHQVDAESRSVEGRMLVKPDGTVQAMVRAPVASFRSGDSNRDVHMEEVVESGRFPTVTLRGVAHLSPDLRLPAGAIAMEAEVELHGVRRPVHLELAVERRPDGALRVKGAFDVSLDAFGIERPALLFVKVDDACHVEVDLLLKEVGP